ncbi:unnamed protein product [Caenorhabditis auriculariae]|uniref:Uncharacterized protein n=1 Tax=Caenorhabditis auriculariae TaxID=2777116 RepID=A0A8S1GWN1_9PELO|nr:unnamed protein product [Caenorhabditis auriculariae]
MPIYATQTIVFAHGRRATELDRRAADLIRPPGWPSRTCPTVPTVCSPYSYLFTYTVSLVHAAPVEGEPRSF